MRVPVALHLLAVGIVIVSSFCSNFIASILTSRSGSSLSIKWISQRSSLSELSTQTLQQFINYGSGFPYHSHWFPRQFPLGTLLCHSPSVSLIWGAVDCLVYSPLLRIQEEFILNTVQLLLGWTGDFQPPYMWNWEPGVFFSLLKIFFMK